MSKLHMRHCETDAGMPLSAKQGYFRLGLSGAMCGYMRKTTTVKSKVTCKLCLARMDKGVTNEKVNR